MPICRLLRERVGVGALGQRLVIEGLASTSSRERARLPLREGSSGSTGSPATLKDLLLTVFADKVSRRDSNATITPSRPRYGA
jgi:hypothetical protein